MRWRIGLVTAVAFLAVLSGYYFYAKRQPRAAAGRLVVPDMVHPGDAAFDQYRSYVRIVGEPKGELWTNFKGDRIATISGRLLNQGEKRLEAVELKIILYDSSGKVLKEAVRLPIRPGAALEGRPVDPLETRSFSVNVDGIAHDWNPQQVDVTISGLKLAGR